jgi:hypothetical protein
MVLQFTGNFLRDAHFGIAILHPLTNNYVVAQKQRIPMYSLTVTQRNQKIVLKHHHNSSVPP